MERERYRHNYNDGDIVTDTKFNEIFIFSDRRDGSRAEQSPTELRLATEEEKKKLIDSGSDCVSCE